MKTTVDIPEHVLKEAQAFSGATTKREAVLTALEDYNRRQRIARLAKHLGTFEKFVTREELQSLRRKG